MIIPTLAIQVQTVLSRDVYSQPKLSKAKTAWCAPVRLDFAQQTSTVRTDSSATHGHAMEPSHRVVILVQQNSPAAKLDSVLTIHGNKVKVVKVHPRYTVEGKFDHHQVECDPWG